MCGFKILLRNIHAVSTFATGAIFKAVYQRRKLYYREDNFGHEHNGMKDDKRAQLVALSRRRAWTSDIDKCRPEMAPPLQICYYLERAASILDLSYEINTRSLHCSHRTPTHLALISPLNKARDSKQCIEINDRPC